MPEINAFVFDLDGTLVQIERLKAQSYAKAAVAAGLHCIAFGTPFTEARLREESPLDDRWIVTDPDELIATVDTLLDKEAAGATSGP